MPARPRTSAGLRVAQYVFLIVGVLALGYCGYTLGEAYFYQTYQSWRLDQMRQHRPTDVRAFLKDEISGVWDRATGKQRARTAAHPPGMPGVPRAPLPAGSLLGRMSIPRIGVASIVLEGDDDGVLRLAAGHIPGTALPGSTGNVAIAGHRDTFFRRLRDVRLNDEISLTTPSETYRYRVDWTDIVGPKDVGVLKPSAKPSLTLVTCYPFDYIGSAPKRFVVRAEQIPSSQTVASAAAGAVPSTAALRPPATLPGESAVAPVRPTAVHHRAMRRRPRPSRLASDDTIAQRSQADWDAQDDDEGASTASRRREGARGLATRLRAQWGRLFAHLKANKDQSAKDETDLPSQAQSTNDPDQ